MSSPWGTPATLGTCKHYIYSQCINPLTVHQLHFGYGGEPSDLSTKCLAEIAGGQKNVLTIGIWMLYRYSCVVYIKVIYWEHFSLETNWNEDRKKKTRKMLKQIVTEALIQWSMTPYKTTLAVGSCWGEPSRFIVQFFNQLSCNLFRFCGYGEQNAYAWLACLLGVGVRAVS